MTEDEKLTISDILHRFANKIIRYYQTLSGNTNSNLVAYHTEQILIETIKEIEDKEVYINGYKEDSALGS